MTESLEGRIQRLEETIEQLKQIVVGSSEGAVQEAGGSRGWFESNALSLLQAFSVLLRQAGAVVGGSPEPGDVLVFSGHAAQDSAEAQVMALSLLRADDRIAMARVARALSSDQRLSVLVALLDGERSAQELAVATGQEGGPLYHHLRELMAQDLAAQPQRNRYRITPRGRDAFATIACLLRRHQGETDDRS
ncbi:MAG: winged helix-turn-helix domain-containing protein [Bacillota bacterium]|nr:winged helix-turn-helix domain-containing protein [Bacillota bacterium]